MLMKCLTTVLLLLAGLLMPCSLTHAAEYAVSPTASEAGDENPGTVAKPLKTLAKALALAKAGDTIVLGEGQYPATTIKGVFNPPLTICAAKGAQPAFVNGLLVQNTTGLRLSGARFTWIPASKPNGRMTQFIRIAGCKDVELADCEIVDDPALTSWIGWACDITDSDGVTVRDSKVHHVHFGVTATMSKNIIFRNLDIGPWTHEDGIRLTECEGPVLVEGCHMTNAFVSGTKGGHTDGMQVVFWTDNLTVRNCRIHGVAHGFGAYHCADPNAKINKPRRTNWRFEGNLVYDIYTPNAITIVETDGVVFVNNTMPQNCVNLDKCTDVVVKNNIFGSGDIRNDAPVQSDYNLWVTGGLKVQGQHDLRGADPRFVNAPLAWFKTDHRFKKDVTRTKLFSSAMKGRIAVGDKVEVHNTDGGGSDGKLRTVTAVGDSWIEVAPPLGGDPDPLFGVIVFKWPDGHTNFTPDYRLRADSPAIDSADSGVGRGKDADGHEAVDVPGTPNSGAGPVKYLDRGAFECVPPR